MMKKLALVGVLLMVLPGRIVSAQELRRRTLVVTPNLPADKAPKLLVHKNFATVLVFEEAPKTAVLEKAEGRVDVSQMGTNVLILPKVELGNRERLSLTVTAPDGARLVFGVEDGFNSEVDGQVIIRRGRASLEPKPEECFVSFVLAQDRTDLKAITYQQQQSDVPSLEEEGAVLALGFAIVLVNFPVSDGEPLPEVRVQGEGTGELEVLGVRRDQYGLLVAVKKPAVSGDSLYMVEVSQRDAAPLVNRAVALWPVTTAQRTLKK